MHARNAKAKKVAFALHIPLENHGLQPSEKCQKLDLHPKMNNIQGFSAGQNWSSHLTAGIEPICPLL